MRIRCLIPLLLASVMVLTSMSQCRKEDPGQVSNRVQARIDGIMYGRGNESYTSGRRPVLTGSEEGFRFQFSTTLYPAGVEDTDELRREEVTLKLYVRGTSAIELDRSYPLGGSGRRTNSARPEEIMTLFLRKAASSSPPAPKEACPAPLNSPPCAPIPAMPSRWRTESLKTC